MSARKSITPLLGFVLGLTGWPLAGIADSGVGVDLWLANKLDPSAGADSRRSDTRGASIHHEGVLRTPSGHLLSCPAEPPPLDADAAWQHYGRVQVGYLATSGDDRNANWQRYVDWDSELVLGLFELHLLRPADGSYVDIRASRLSDHDQYYKVRAGRAGSWRMEAFSRSTPNVLSSNARSIWNGVGSNNLTLKEGLIAAGSSPAQVAAVIDQAPERILQVNRDKQGLGLNYYFNPRWTGYAQLSNEQRSGTRPFGGAMFFNFPFPNNGGALETIRPVQDSTINSNLGMRFAGRQWRMDFGYSGSFYRDRYRSFDWETPYALYPVVPGATSSRLTGGQFSTEPDNDYHNLRATFTRKLPLNGQISLTAGGASMRQNDKLLAPINCQGTFGIDLTGGSGVLGPANPFLFPCSEWNTTEALLRPRAGMRIDTSLFDTRVVLQPHPDWSLRGGLRYYREDYRNTWLAYNPLTGDYGYVAENGSQGSVVPGEVGLWNPVTSPSTLTRVLSLPLDAETTEANLGADWRLGQHDMLGATVAVSRYEPGHRERQRVDDHSVKLNWSNKAFSWMTLRANYTWLQRSGDRYNYNPYEFTFSSSLPGFVAPPGGVPAHTVDAMRKYDLSSRDQNKLDLMATFMPRDNMSLSASLRGDWNDYDARIGRQNMDTLGFSLQWEWQPSPRTNASAFVTLDRSKLGIANVNEIVTNSPDPGLGGATYALDGRWWAHDTQRNQSFGALLNHDFGRVRVDANWTYLNARGSTDFNFASPLALAYPTDTLADAFPTMRYRLNSVTLGLTFAVTERIGVRVFDYYERGSISDWHYAGFGQTRVYDHRVYSDGGPRSYNANLAGVMLNVKL